MSEHNPKGDRAAILAQYADGPVQLERVINDLTDTELDHTPSTGGWSIREIVHHIADGDDIWTVGIKMALGNEHAEFHLDWYSPFPQTTWASHWAYAKRPVHSSLALLKATRANVLDLLAHRTDAWERSATIREPNGEITRVSVGFIVEMQASHVFHHIKRIEEIRREHGVTSGEL
ncbi:MAG: DinB family protein [Bacteroidetes bacterium]|nr:DinB family protein [Bacteroidota bacterium]